MPRYVDGFVLPVPKRKLPAYRRLVRRAGKVWRDLGALEYRECVGDQLEVEGAVSFRERFAAKRDEAVIFSWITYRSRAHRERVNARVLRDPRMAKLMQEMEEAGSMPFDARRMTYGGFTVLVDA